MKDKKQRLKKTFKDSNITLCKGSFLSLIRRCNFILSRSTSAPEKKCKHRVLKNVMLPFKN